jgi:hypothetical protein
MSRRKSSGFNRSIGGDSMPERNYFCGDGSSAKFENKFRQRWPFFMR